VTTGGATTATAIEPTDGVGATAVPSEVKPIEGGATTAATGKVGKLLVVPTALPRLRDWLSVLVVRLGIKGLADVAPTVTPVVADVMVAATILLPTRDEEVPSVVVGVVGKTAVATTGLKTLGATEATTMGATLSVVPTKLIWFTGKGAAGRIPVLIVAAPMISLL
jgi:hypothetical protein